MESMEKVEILLAEDNDKDAEMTQRALRKHNLGNRVYWVKDGAEALDFVFCTGAYANRKFTDLPKLILLDLKMPKVDGIEVLRKIKSDERTRLLPVVMMTSSNEERDVVESYRLGVNSYIVKPIEFSAFVDVVAKIGLYWVVANRQPAA
jgi:two-component system, response regulator